MHAPYILSADDLDDLSGILLLYWKPSILAADDFLEACCRKAMTPKKLWTLLGRREKNPHPQDKIQHLDFTRDPAALLQDPSLCIYHKNVRSKAVFGP